MIQALAVQVEAIRSALSVDPGPATSRPTERPADEALDELDAMMAAADFAALAGLRQLAPALHGHFGAAAAAVEAALQRFDFEEARVALRALRARDGPPGG